MKMNKSGERGENMRENRRRAAKIDIPESPKPEKTPTATPVSEEKEPTNTPAPGQGGSSYRGGGYGGSSGGSSAGTSSPKTGDTSDMALWQCLLLMAIAAILATGWKLQKRKINK